MKTLINSSILSVVMLSIGMSVQAQESYKFSTTFVVNGEEHDYERLAEFRSLFDNAMETRGAEYSENEGFLFLLGFSEENESGQLALSLTTLAKMPESIVRAGKSSQILYTALDDKDTNIHLAEDANMVREELTGDFMRQFTMVMKQRIMIVDASELREEIDTIVDEILRE